MAQTFGFVLEIGEDGRATVVAEKGQGCGSCSAVSQCRGGRATRTERTPALNRAGAAVGDRVMLTVESSVLLSRMALLYLLPVFGILAGAFTGALMYGGLDGTGGGLSIAFGLAGFVFGLGLAVAISRIWSAARPVMPIISRIVNTRSASPSAGQSAGCGCGAK